MRTRNDRAHAAWLRIEWLALTTGNQPLLITIAHDIMTCYDRFKRFVTRESFVFRLSVFIYLRDEDAILELGSPRNGIKIVVKIVSNKFVTRIIPPLNSLFFGTICSVVKWLVYLALALSNDASAGNLRDVLRKVLSEWWDFVTGMKEQSDGWRLRCFWSWCNFLFFFFFDPTERERKREI